MNKRWLAALASALLLVTLASSPALAQSRGHGPGTFGLGIGSGTMTRLGLSGKYFMGSRAIQGDIGCGGWSCSGVGASLDYLFEMPPLASGRALNLAWNAGLGPGVALRDDAFALAAAGVLGLELNFKAIPIDLVGEWRPTLRLVPDTHFDPVEFSGQLRLYFY